MIIPLCGSRCFRAWPLPETGGIEPVKFALFILALVMEVFLFPFPSIAQHQHGGQSMPGMPGMEGEKKMEPSVGNETSASRAFLLEGVKASFSLMPMADH